MKVRVLVTMVMLCVVQVFGTLIEIQGPSVTTDATVNSFNATTNYGSATSYELRNYQTSSRQWAVVRFELPTLNPGEYISDATMTFDYFANYNTTSGSMTVSLHQLSYSWDESQVTWNNRTTTTPWTSGNIGYAPPPANYSATSLGTVTLTYNAYGLKTFQSSELTAVLNQMASGTLANNGFLLHPTAESGGPNNRFYLASSERTDQEAKPLLTLTIIPEPMTIILLSFGSLLGFCRRK